MRQFKSLKEEMLKFMLDKSGFVSRLKDDGTRYGSIGMDDLVNNNLLGIVKVQDIVNLESTGAIIYQDKQWKVKTFTYEVDSQNIERFAKGTQYLGKKFQLPVKEWYDYIDSLKDETQKLINQNI
jgi:hypothetical protein